MDTTQQIISRCPGPFYYFFNKMLQMPTINAAYSSFIADRDLQNDENDHSRCSSQQKFKHYSLTNWSAFLIHAGMSPNCYNKAWKQIFIGDWETTVKLDIVLLLLYCLGSICKSSTLIILNGPIKNDMKHVQVVTGKSLWILISSTRKRTSGIEVNVECKVL